MEDKAVQKKVSRDVEIELYCECGSMLFSTIWIPGAPWCIDVSGVNRDLEMKFKDLLHIFNTVKTKFDTTIRRLEREYKQFGEAVKELPTIEETP